MCTCTGLSDCCFKIIAFFLLKLMQDSPSLSDFINNPTVRKQQKQRERTTSHWSQWAGITITITCDQENNWTCLYPK